MSQELVNEMKMEAIATRHLLERVPEESLEWTPHTKSMTLGQLALHVARIPGDMSRLAQRNEFDVASAPGSYVKPASKQELLDTLDKSIESAEAYLNWLTPEALGAIWLMTAGGKELLKVPRAGMLRVLLLNHWYHHRGQLTVYLRLLDVPLPIVYGRSADESPAF